jgi:hypothetical protein
MTDMPETTYRGRRAFFIENERLRVTVVAGGGHIAEILHKPTEVNPLWTPHWPSIDPSTWDRQRHPEYGDNVESKLLAGLLGHNLALDTFGAPSPEEEASGVGCHGEASVATYRITGNTTEVTCECDLPAAQLCIERRLALAPSSRVLRITETVANLSVLDRPVAWTQHVTIGRPFLERGVTQFRIPDVCSMSLEGVEAPAEGVSTFTNAESSGGFVTHLVDPSRAQGYFLAFSPRLKVLLGYVWRRADFPWIGIWEENHFRKHLPWDGQELTRGMEFGASPFPESRRKMIDRREMFGTTCYRWIPAKSRVNVDYCAFVDGVEALPKDMTWDGRDTVETS